ncbi:hypothetical protein BJ166DRAFT_327859 [Pestalotiopsis sp. NC0098]|nr:hypothetical protein BJ166DRAFT_327859 [Pestalotiopsis sp. NC0098]
MSYTTPPITSTTVYGALETYSAVHAAPPLLTRFMPPAQCETDWYWDTAALRSSSTAFSDGNHNTAWSTCQPYSVSTSTYSAGICPWQSEFKSVTQVSWDGVSSSYYVGACCASTASYDTYQSGAATGLYGCIATVTSETVVATMVQENDEPTAVTSSGPITVIAEPLYMVWHESDTTLHAGSDSSSLLAAMNMAMPSATTTATSTPTPSSGTDPEDEAEEEEEEEGSGMTNAAVAGISAGFAVCGMLIAMLSYLAFIRPKRHRNTTEPNPASGSGSGPGQSPRGAQAWNDGAVYANEHQTPTPNTIDKTHSLANQNSAETLDSRDPQMSHALRPAHQDKDEFLIEQKMLLR